MKIALSDHFDYKRLLRFTFPSICMMIFTSIYGVVDGFFVSNFAGATAFAAVNFIMPYLMILGTAGFMIGSGGSALIGKTMGEQEMDQARKQFSLLVYFSVALAVLLAVLGLLFLKQAALLLGCSASMLPDCLLYGRIIICVLPAYILQMEFQSFFVTAQKPQLGLWVTVASGCANMILDFLFVGIFSWSVAGAALATSISQIIGGILPLFYLMKKRSSPLYLTKTSWNGREIAATCSNGLSELMANVSVSLVSMLYNWQLLRMVGENGVSAYGVLMYVSMIFNAVFFGYSMGVAPVISYHYGAGDKKELKNLKKRSFVLIAIFSVLMFAAAELLSDPLSLIFVGYDSELMEITVHAFSYYSYVFLFAGFAIFGSGFFTALNNGIVSALISFFRTLVFQVGAVIIFPILWGVDGIWLSISFAELAACLLVWFFLKRKQSQYGY